MKPSVKITIISSVIGILLSLIVYLLWRNQEIRRMTNEIKMESRRMVDKNNSSQSELAVFIEKNMRPDLPVPDANLLGDRTPNIPLYDVPRIRSPFLSSEQRTAGQIKQLGILTRDGQNQSQPAVLPLYGARLYRGSDKWRYYSETDKYRPIRLEVSRFRNGSIDKCSDQYGCDELYDGDRVKIDAYNDPYVADIYERTISYDPFPN